MWITTKDGFFSIIQHRDDSRRLIIRARAKSDLFKLAEHLSVELDDVETDPLADYRYRLGQSTVAITRSDLIDYLETQVNEIDYDSHVKEVLSNAASKNTIEAAAPALRTRRYHWYLDVWGAGHDFQLQNQRRDDPADSANPADPADLADLADLAEDVYDLEDLEADLDGEGFEDLEAEYDVVNLLERIEDLEVVNAKLLDQLTRAVSGDPIDVELVDELLADPDDGDHRAAIQHERKGLQ